MSFLSGGERRRGQQAEKRWCCTSIESKLSRKEDRNASIFFLQASTGELQPVWETLSKVFLADSKNHYRVGLIEGAYFTLDLTFHSLYSSVDLFGVNCKSEQIVPCFSLFEIIIGTLEEIWSLWLFWLIQVAMANHVYSCSTKTLLLIFILVTAEVVQFRCPLAVGLYTL